MVAALAITSAFLTDALGGGTGTLMVLLCDHSTCSGTESMQISTRWKSSLPADSYILHHVISSC